MKLIKQIYDLITLATDKGITGYFSDSKIMDAIHQGQMVLWRQLIKKYPQDKRVRNDLLPFEVQATITLTGTTRRIGSVPQNFEQEIEAWAADEDGVLRPITFFERGFFRAQVNDPVDVPSRRSPIANIFFDASRQIEIAPVSVSQIDSLVYFRKPVKPVFSTIESGGTYIYDDATSIDVEWSESMYDIIIQKALAPLGLSMRDGQVQAAGAAVEPKEATI